MFGSQLLNFGLIPLSSRTKILKMLLFTASLLEFSVKKSVENKPAS